MATCVPSNFRAAAIASTSGQLYQYCTSDQLARSGSSSSTGNLARGPKEMAIWLSHVVEALGLAGVTFSRFILAYCRINRVFESSKSTLAQVSGDPSYLWAEYDLGTLRRAFALAEFIGMRRGLLAVIRDDVCERCKHWKGIERRSCRGTYLDRSAPGGRVHIRRFTDDPRLVALILRGPSILKDAA